MSLTTIAIAVLVLVLFAAISLCRFIKTMSPFFALSAKDENYTSSWPLFSHHRVWVNNERCDEFYIDGYRASRKQYYSARISLASMYVFGILAIVFVISGISMLIGNKLAG